LYVQESEEIPPDYTRLFRSQLFSIDTALLPRVITTYKYVKTDIESKFEVVRTLTRAFILGYLLKVTKRVLCRGLLTFCLILREEPSMSTELVLWGYMYISRVSAVH
jgi:hypothetical protein